MRAKTISPSTNREYGMKRVCQCWQVSRSAVYARQVQKDSPQKRGPKPQVSDDEILMEIRQDLHETPFYGEGHRKVHARIRRQKGVVVGRERVRKLMGKCSLLSPYRVQKGKAKTHDGTITTEAPNIMWATDATKIPTIEDGLVWFFGIVEHWNAECLG